MKVSNIKMFKISLVLVAFFVVSTPGVSAYSATIDGNSWNLNDHPRLMINNSDLAALRSKTASNPIWTTLTNDIAGYMQNYWNVNTHTWTGSCASLPWGGDALGVLGVTQSMSLYYLMYPNGTLGAVPAVEYGRFAKQVLADMAAGTCGYDDSKPWTENVNRDYGSFALRSIGLIWDWIYNVDGDGLISSDALFQDSVLSWINDTMIPMVESHELFTSFNSDWSLIPPESNLMVTAWSGRLAIGLATYEDNEPTDNHGFNAATKNSVKYVNDAYGWYINYLLPHKNIYMQGGHGLDGSEYQMFRTGHLQLEGLRELTTAIAEVDTATSIVGNWIEEQGAFDVFRSMPNPLKKWPEGTFGFHEFHLNDFRWVRGLLDLALIQWEYDTPSARQSRDFIKRVFDPYNHQVAFSPHYVCDWFIYWDESAPVIDYKTMPTFVFSEGNPALISKTGWGTTDTWTHYRAADGWSARHPYTSATNATDYTRGVLAFTGSYSIFKGDEYLLYENISDTSIDSCGTPNKYNILRFDNSVTNFYGTAKAHYVDGMYTYSAETTDGGANGGRVTTEGTYFDDSIRYVKTDMTGAYLDIGTSQGGGGTVVDNVHRTFIHNTDNGEDYTIVYDYIDKDSSYSTNVEELLHYPGNPTINGNSITYVGNANTLVSTVVYPAMTTITKADETDTTIGIDGDDAWKVAVSIGTDDVQRALIIHHLIGTSVAGISDTEFIGASIQDSTRNRIFLFSKGNTPPTGDITFTTPVDTVDIRVFISDLSPNTEYHYTSSVVSNSLTFTLGGSGTAVMSNDAGTISLLVTGVSSVGPARSNGSPSGEQSTSTTQVTMSLTTDVNATCKYNADGVSGVVYDSMTNTMSTTGGTSHSQIITGLTSGNSYSRAIRCTDGTTANDTDYIISWTTAVADTRADVDQSSNINSTDAMLTLRNSLGLDISSTNWQVSATTGDANCDSSSNSTDAMLILRQSLGLDMSGTGWCVG